MFDLTAGYEATPALVYRAAPPSASSRYATLHTLYHETRREFAALVSVQLSAVRRLETLLREPPPSVPLDFVRELHRLLTTPDVIRRVNVYRSPD